VAEWRTCGHWQRTAAIGGRLTFIGSPPTVADSVANWRTARAADVRPIVRGTAGRWVVVPGVEPAPRPATLAKARGWQGWPASTAPDAGGWPLDVDCTVGKGLARVAEPDRRRQHGSRHAKKRGRQKETVPTSPAGCTSRPVSAATTANAGRGAVSSLRTPRRSAILAWSTWAAPVRLGRLGFVVLHGCETVAAEYGPRFSFRPGPVPCGRGICRPHFLLASIPRTPRCCKRVPTVSVALLFDKSTDAHFLGSATRSRGQTVAADRS